MENRMIYLISEYENVINQLNLYLNEKMEQTKNTHFFEKMVIKDMAVEKGKVKIQLIVRTEKETKVYNVLLFEQQKNTIFFEDNWIEYDENVIEEKYINDEPEEALKNVLDGVRFTYHYFFNWGEYMEKTSKEIKDLESRGHF